MLCVHITKIYLVTMTTIKILTKKAELAQLKGYKAIPIEVLVERLALSGNTYARNQTQTVYAPTYFGFYESRMWKTQHHGCMR